ncbi:hypothetical protein EI94DRAFT_1727429, partial [Lactarius quietus]
MQTEPRLCTTAVAVRLLYLPHQSVSSECQGETGKVLGVEDRLQTWTFCSWQRSLGHSHSRVPESQLEQSKNIMSAAY